MKMLGLLLTCGLIIVGARAAHAVCNVNSITSVTPLTANTGTYTPPTLPGSVAVAFTINGTYTALLGDTCTVALSFQRTTLPPSMARSGGGATLSYTITSAAGGGNSLLYTDGTPVATARLQASFTAPLLVLAPQAFAPLTVTAHFQMQPGSPQLAGSYSDSINAGGFRVVGGTLTQIASFGFTVNGTVNKVCYIGGVATPAADSATIPVTAGTVNTAPISKTYTGACNTPTNLQLTSQLGGVRVVATPPSGFTNIINYTANGTFSAVSSTINTATVPTAAGPEAGNVSTLIPGTPSGNLVVTITPQANVLRLLQGSYTDTLRVTLTPQ